MVSFPEWCLKARAIPASVLELQLKMLFKQEKKRLLEFERQFNVILRQAALAGLLSFWERTKRLRYFLYQ